MGISKGNSGSTGSGGLCRDEHGNILFAFPSSLGIQNNTYAKMAAIIEGLKLCVIKGFNRIWLELDAQVVIHILKGKGFARWELQNLLASFLLFQSKMTLCISNIFREGNGGFF